MCVCVVFCLRALCVPCVFRSYVCVDVCAVSVCVIFFVCYVCVVCVVCVSLYPVHVQPCLGMHVASSLLCDLYNTASTHDNDDDNDDDDDDDDGDL
jgi:hypothetical protein